MGSQRGTQRLALLIWCSSSVWRGGDQGREGGERREGSHPPSVGRANSSYSGYAISIRLFLRL